MLVLLVLTERQNCKLGDLFKKTLLSRDDDNDSVNFLRQLPPPAAVLGVPRPPHPCTRALGQPQPGAELPAPSASPSKGPSRNRLPIPPAHERRQQGQGNTSPPRTPPSDLGHGSVLPSKHHIARQGSQARTTRPFSQTTQIKAGLWLRCDIIIAF